MNDRVPEPTDGQRNIDRPRLDVFEREDTLEVLADLPGTDSDAIDVEYDDGLLTVQAEVRSAPATAADTVRLWRFEVQLGELVSGDEIRAVYQQGVLQVSLPKPPQRRLHRIDVRER